MTQKETFLELCSQVKRDGFNELLDWLKNSTDFFTAPASTKFHGNYEGGLLDHSLNVYKELVSITNLYHIQVENETLIIISLFHDLCKTNFYKKGFRNVKDADGKWIQKEVYEVDDEFPFGYHADKSIILIQRFIKLTDQEIYAIRAHMGGFDTAIKGGDYAIAKIFDISPIAVALHIADMVASYLDDKKLN